MVKSAQRILHLMELLTILPEPTGVSEIARYLEIPKSSAQALLETLVSRGYAERQGTAYSLVPSMREGGWVGGEFALLKRVALPVMRQVVVNTGESAFLGIRLPNWRIRYVEKVVSPNEVRYDGGLGHDRPAYCTSIGHLFLAAATAAEVDAYFQNTRLEKVTADTEVDAAALGRMLDDVRKSGWAQSRNGHVDGASGVAAAVLNAAGKPIAGLTVAAPTWRFDRSREHLVEATRASAEDISRSLRALAHTRGGERSSRPDRSNAHLTHQETSR